MLAVALCVALAQLSPPPLVPLEDPTSPPPVWSPAPARSARLLSAPKGPTTGQLVVRSVLSPFVAFGVGVLTVPLALFLGSLMGYAIDPINGESVGGAFGAIAGGALGYIGGTSIASTFFERDLSGLKRALPWATGAATIATLGVCLVFFVPGIGLAGLPWVIAGAVALAAAVPLVTEAARPRAPELAPVTVVTF